MTFVLARAGRFTGTLAFAVLMGAAAILSGAAAAIAQEGTPHLMLELKDGTVDIELMPEIAPQHVERIVTLTQSGFYDGIVFHRVWEGFMAQTGDPTGTGSGGSALPDVVAEFSTIPYDRAIVGAARTPDPNSFNSQFFIMLGNNYGLNGQYTVFGKVVDGMDFVDMIKKGDIANNGLVEGTPDNIVSATIVYK